MDFLLYAASLDASVATRSKISGFDIRERSFRSVIGRRTIDKRVQYGHGTVGNTGIGVHLLENYSRRRVSEARR